MPTWKIPTRKRDVKLPPLANTLCKSVTAAVRRASGRCSVISRNPSRCSVTGGTSQKQDGGKPCSQILVHGAGGGRRSEWPRGLSGVPTPLRPCTLPPGVCCSFHLSIPLPVAPNKPMPGDVSQSPEKSPKRSRSRSKQHLTLHKACVWVLTGKHD